MKFFYAEIQRKFTYLSSEASSIIKFELNIDIKKNFRVFSDTKNWFHPKTGKKPVKNPKITGTVNFLPKVKQFQLLATVVEDIFDELTPIVYQGLFDRALRMPAVCPFWSSWLFVRFNETKLFFLSAKATWDKGLRLLLYTLKKVSHQD